MPPRKRTDSTVQGVALETLRHTADLTRRNIPTAETSSLVAEEESAARPMLYPRNPDLDPQLVWRGKDALDAEPWTPTTTLNVTVSDGVVDLWGSISNEQERHGIRVIAENAAGVKQVNDHMVTIEPYTGTVIEAPDDRK